LEQGRLRIGNQSCEGKQFRTGGRTEVIVSDCRIRGIGSFRAVAQHGDGSFCDQPRYNARMAENENKPGWLQIVFVAAARIVAAVMIGGTVLAILLFLLWAAGILKPALD
jgi:hypothetical protein